MNACEVNVLFTTSTAKTTIGHHQAPLLVVTIHLLMWARIMAFELNSSTILRRAESYQNIVTQPPNLVPWVTSVWSTMCSGYSPCPLFGQMQRFSCKAWRLVVAFLSVFDRLNFVSGHRSMTAPSQEVAPKARKTFYVTKPLTLLQCATVWLSVLCPTCVPIKHCILCVGPLPVTIQCHGFSLPASCVYNFSPRIANQSR